MYLIIGGTGYLGSYCIKNILEYTDNSIVATYNNTKPHLENKRIHWIKLDISDFKQIDNFCEKFSKEKFKVIYLSAYHRPDKAEENPQIAWHINVACLDYFLNSFKNNIDILYYSSTSYVYGKGIENYVFTEEDKCLPIETYGRTKLLAEQLILLYGFNVARYSLLIGPSIIERKHFFDIIVDSLINNEKIEMFTDFYRTITSFNQAAYYTIQLCEKYPDKKRNIINICTDEHLSKYDLAIKIYEKFNLKNKENIVPISIEGKNSILKTKRAKYNLVDNKKLKELLKIKHINWEF